MLRLAAVYALRRLFGQFAVHGGGIVLLYRIRHGKHFDGQRTAAEGNANHVADLDVVGRLGRAVVDRNARIVAGLVGDGAALDEPRYL